jgi:hypothetical protein
VDPAAFTVETMRARVDTVGDPMQGMWRKAVSLPARFEALGLDPNDREPRRTRKPWTEADRERWSARRRGGS